MSTYSKKEYNGFNNQEISILNDKLENLEKEISILKEKIEEIQNNCEHEYEFVCCSTYHDLYQCCKCGITKYK